MRVLWVTPPFPVTTFRECKQTDLLFLSCSTLQNFWSKVCFLFLTWLILVKFLLFKFVLFILCLLHQVLGEEESTFLI